MGDAGFPWFKPHTDVVQPPFRLLLQHPECCQIAMKDQGVIGVPHDCRLPVAAALAAGNAPTQMLFETMECDVRQQR